MKNTNNKKILFLRLHPAVSNTMQEINRVFLGSNPTAANDATYHNNAHFGCHGYGGEHTVLLEDRLIAFSVLLLLLPVLIIRAFLAQVLTGSIIDKRKLAIHQDQILLLRFSGYFIGRKLLLMVNVMRGDIQLIGRTDYSSSRDTVPLKDYAEPFGVYSVAALRRLTGTDYTDEKDSKHTISGYRAKITFLLRYCIAILISPKNQLHRLPKIDVLGVSIDNYSISDALEKILPPDTKYIHSQRSVHSNAEISYPSDKKKVFAFVNPDCLNKAVKDQEYRIALDNMDGIFADGIGLQIAAKILGQQFKANVNGTDLFPLLCEHSKSRQLSIYLLGGRDGIAEATASWCRDNYPGLEIAGTQHGYFSMSETQTVIEKINRSGADILLVAFGAPHQEKWLNEHAATLSPLLQMGVGGLFDFYSGRISRSPRWMQEIGLEWVWRLMQEPKRMWQRYIIGNPVFLYHVIKQRLTTGKKKLNPGISKVRRSSALQSSRLHFRQLSWRIFVGSTYAIKRVGDIFIAGCCTLLLSPLLLIVTVLIKLESPGPVFFSQTRVGRYGCFFKIYKFRSMYIDAEERKAQLSAENEIAGGVLFKMKSDPRVTRVGRFIRKYSIDELPQLLNVIRGDMSLVGPRPPLPGEVNEYKLADRRRLEIKPGITCIWQVSGRSDIPFDQQVQLDVDYIESQSIGQDIKILFKTIPAVLLGKGAY